MLSLRSELEKIVHSIEINYHPEKIILYGSMAAGREIEGSDIDILAVVSEKENDIVNILNKSKTLYFLTGYMEFRCV